MSKVTVSFQSITQLRHAPDDQGHQVRLSVHFTLVIDDKPVLEPETGQARVFEAVLRLTVGSKYDKDFLQLVGVPAFSGIPQNWTAFADAAASYYDRTLARTINVPNAVMTNNRLVARWSTTFEAEDFRLPVGW